MDSLQKLWSFIWKACLPPKVKVFGWKFVAIAVPVRESLAKRGVQVSQVCSMCDQVETQEELTLSCE